MARNRTLLDILVQFRDEAGVSNNVAHNQGARDKQVRLLQRVQRRLWEDKDWKFLEVNRDIELEAGQRYFALPTDMVEEKLKRVEYRHNGVWAALVPEIGAQELSFLDSDRDERQDPVSKFEIREGTSVEVWPIPATGYDPATGNGLIRIWGQRDLRPFTDDKHRADLDGDLIALHAALEQLADKESPRANLVSEKLQRLEKRLFAAGSKIKQFGYNTGRGSGGARQPHHPVLGPSVYRNN